MNNLTFKSNTIIFFILLLLLLPTYNYLFIGSMETALDRDQYLYMMEYPFGGREEPLIHVLSWSLGFIVDSPFVKLVLIQNFFIILLLLVFAFFCDIGKYTGVSKFLLFFLVFLVVYSNMLGVQLRVGYATIIYLFLVFSILGCSYLINKKTLYLFLPILMHFGTFFSCLFYLIYAFFKINNYRRNLIFILLMCFLVLILFKFIPVVLSSIGINAYYLDYLNRDSVLNDGRKYPFTLFFYIFILFLLFLNKKIYRTEAYYFCYSGLVLIFMAIFLDFYVAYKFLLPISAYSFIFYMKNFNIKYDNIIYYILITVVVFCIFYYTFSKQVGLF
ncbi:hypothetical protein [Acinetobacter sp. 161(2023)]|uniref:hypothetical protein n=1 Tax=Acinetobacter sp. 161(2023) TaxID=3098768 RepID=UPI003009CF96